MKIWILTEEYNDYNQYGEYFIAAFSSKPTVNQLKVRVRNCTDIEALLKGGGRSERNEDQWYNLVEETLK